MKILKVIRSQVARLGDTTETTIHTIVDKLPISSGIKSKIKNCRGCKQRKTKLNRLGAKLTGESVKPSPGNPPA